MPTYLTLDTQTVAGVLIVEMNDLTSSSKVHTKSLDYKQSAIEYIWVDPDDTYCVIEMVNGTKYPVSFDGSAGLPISTINGNQPTSNQDLRTKLRALIV